MIKNDSQLQRDIVEELRWDPQTSLCEIGVAVGDGVVTLSGSVASYAQKLAAERAAGRVAGVRAIAEDLSVNLDAPWMRTDVAIAHAAVDALRWDTQVPDDRMQVRVEDGWITLTGDVTWKFQSRAAEHAVRFLTGVRGLTNLVHVRTSASVAMVKSKIEEALERHAEIDARLIEVEAVDGKVTLKGSVHSWAERHDAESAAWAAPGVTAVDDRLTISA